MRSVLKATTNDLKQLLFPPRCIFCGAVLPPKSGDTCTACAKNLPYVEDGNILRKVGKYTCAVTFYYDDMVQQGIRAMKFRGRKNRAERFAPYLARTVAEHLGGEFDAVTFVPIHFLRRIHRGFDQTERIATTMADIWEVNLLKTLQKTRNNRPQSSVKDMEKRRKNVRNAYKAVNLESFCGKHLLLIDDVVTSGSTLTACADALLAAGAASVVCASFAGGHAKKKRT